MIVHRGKTIEEVIELLAKYKDSKIIAGGTDVILDIKDNKIFPEALIDISSIEELKGIELKGDFIEIGAGTTFTEIAEDEIFEKNLHGLKKACKLIGSPQIRNRGTVGGNIVNGSPAADSIPPLLCLESTLIFESLEGIRKVKLEDYLKSKYRIKEHELLTKIRFKNPEGLLNFIKLAIRKALAISRMSIATLIELDEEEKVKDIKVASGSLGRYPMRELEVEEFLLGTILGEYTVDEAVNILQNAMEKRLKGRPTLPYKKRAVKSLLKEALNQRIRSSRRVIS
ncbi:FAD binding domain-containing protein [Schnuerera sp. xch1]|uniref:FAD binding domain-containing protein n=1 Tax=Schnuerera sp. xch1 TaxID=2874283 RepID=UPI001CBDCE67|nr:FAD binding domain-containing protein [Schnuerera sp. xch1]MBZ2175163.1 FAD binding domain-containing protein [Schnuerera sp. xch1]